MDRDAKELLIAYVSNNNVTPKDFVSLIRDVSGAVQAMATKTGLIPPVPVEQSIHRDFLICLEDGNQVTLLKRYLKTHFNMTPGEYLQKWGLPENYPMVAASYSEKRSQIAKDNGLGKTERGAA